MKIQKIVGAARNGQPHSFKKKGIIKNIVKQESHWTNRKTWEIKKEPKGE